MHKTFSISKTDNINKATEDMSATTSSIRTQNNNPENAYRQQGFEGVSAHGRDLSQKIVDREHPINQPEEICSSIKEVTIEKCADICVRADTKSQLILSSVGGECATKLGYRYISDIFEARKAVLEIVQSLEVMGLDIETAKNPFYIDHPRAGLQPHLSKIRLIQIATTKVVYVFDTFVQEMMDALKPVWVRDYVSHNAAFEYQHLLHAGISNLNINCTMLMENALTNAKLPSLADLAKKYMGLNIDKAQQHSDWSNNVLSEDQIRYAAFDAWIVKKLLNILSAHLKTQNKMELYRLMRGAIRTVSKMMLQGICFDAKAHQNLSEIWLSELKKSEDSVRKVMGDKINLQSSVQINKWIEKNVPQEVKKHWTRTKTGYSTRAEILKTLPNLPVLEPFLQYKEFFKLNSSFGKTFVEHINPITGRIHPEFLLGNTSTGRMTCQKPNIQQVPRQKDFRALFVSPPGKMLVVADYSQIELRVAALLSQDPTMLEAYLNGKDLHKVTAASITRGCPDQVTKDQRQAAKAVNFGLLYGQGAAGLAKYAQSNYGVTMSVDDAEMARQTFFSTFPLLRSYQQKEAKKAEQLQMVNTRAGRKRDFSKEKNGYSYTEALNTPIQGTAAEIMLSTLCILERFLQDIDARLVNVVHDEIVLEVADQDVEKAKISLSEAMTKGFLNIFPEAGNYLIGLVEVKSGYSWAEAK